MEKTLAQVLNEANESDILPDLIEVELMGDEPSDEEFQDIEIGEDDWNDEIQFGDIE